MFSGEFELAFQNFLDCKEYDAAEEALFSMARLGFIAGWQAASGMAISEGGIADAATKYDMPAKK